MRILNKKEFSKTIQSPKGITLIALIITVILMLILAAVAISAVTGTEGLFKRSQNAADTYKAKAEAEKSLLESLINSVEKYNNAGSNSGGNAGGEGGNVTPEEDTTAPADVTLEATNKTETSFTLSATAIDESGVASFKFVVYEGDEEPAEWTTVTATDNAATLDVTGKTTGTEYTCKVKAVDTKENESDVTEIKVTLVYSENRTYDNQATGTYSNPIIPKGFYPVNENGANWGTAEGYKKGLVIEDAVGNQYVWVPVDGTNVTFGREDWKYPEGHSSEGQSIGISKDDCSEVLPEALTTSVTNNHGFYIARFEAGVSDAMKVALKNANNGTEVTSLTSNTTATYGTGTYLPVSKQGAMVWNNIAYGSSGNGARKVASSLYPESSSNYGVVSTLIYGAQWDTALNFIGAYNVGEEGYDTYATNSEGMGNYYGTNGGDTSTATPDVCGVLPAFRQKNIYDMAGNVHEWTNEEWDNGYYPIYRGGSCNWSGSYPPASYRGRSDYTYSSYSNVGFRLALYIRSN